MHCEAEKRCQQGERNAPGWIRTSDLRIRSPLLYPAELQGLDDSQISRSAVVRCPAVLDRHAIAFLVAARRLGVDYGTTLQIGRQAIPAGTNVEAAFRDAGAPPGQVAEDRYAEPLLKALGARDAHSLDSSAYEQATHVHDLNEPLPAALRGRYTAVVDSGTLEHVFDVATALRSVLSAVQVGGHFVAITPSNGWAGHGLYQFSPELFHVAMPAHGFEVVTLLVRAHHAFARFYSSPPPAETGGRVPFRSLHPASVYLVARRVEDKAPGLPQQSDYAPDYTPVTNRRTAVKRRLPRALQEPASEAWSTLWTLRRLPIASRQFHRVQLRDL